MANGVKKNLLRSLSVSLLLMGATQLLFQKAFAEDERSLSDDLNSYNAGIKNVSKVVLKENEVLLEFDGFAHHDLYTSSAPIHFWISCEYGPNSKIWLSSPGLNCFGKPRLGPIPFWVERKGDRGCVAFNKSDGAFCKSSSCTSQKPFTLRKKGEEFLIYRCNKDDAEPLRGAFTSFPEGRREIPKPLFARLESYGAYVLATPFRLILKAGKGNWRVPIGAF